MRNFVRAYDIFQRHKTETLQSVGPLQPLPIPTQVWVDISLDFIEGIMTFGGEECFVGSH